MLSRIFLQLQAIVIWVGDPFSSEVFVGVDGLSNEIFPGKLGSVGWHFAMASGPNGVSNIARYVRDRGLLFMTPAVILALCGRQSKHQRTDLSRFYLLR